MKNPFFNTLLGFKPCWDNRLFNAFHVDSPDVYSSDKTLNLSTIDKVYLKCDVTDGSVVNVLRQPILYSFVPNKPLGFKVFYEPETYHFDRINKSVSNTISFYSEDDDHKECNFNGELLAFTVQLIKVWTINGAFKILKPIVIMLVKNTTLVQKNIVGEVTFNQEVVER